ncbi:nascent polypeptide-associated complex subunit beta [Rozella allomycis CSF55]|uniref:Nascent polypeptide-associated complex subunit beta n=1 Tax=Rozella allomycis (strain CSF55) TaxID=988480 RepID=A0A075B4R6_ROZAC|nr:Nascent polypeptide-associated complex subunit beta [Rozella allomycis CSF55]RKP16076.1 nascent polypeptide-associated complex subunit beta [Rozella allomycis CSF55]|eukprot:EPZ36564.1 Nascent polypeptide-associated complex subunit beta [Rozella allomycis CSF55]
MNAEKLAQLNKLKESVRIGGKGTPRRKTKKVSKPAVADDKKLQGALKKLNSQTVAGIEEVNMFQENGKIIHIAAPKVQACGAGSNTFAISGHSEEKELNELVPGILSQLGPDSINTLRKLAETFSQQQAAGAENDDEVPDLVENFEEVAEGKVESA